MPSQWNQEKEGEHLATSMRLAAFKILRPIGVPRSRQLINGQDQVLSHPVSIQSPRLVSSAHTFTPQPCLLQTSYRFQSSNHAQARLSRHQ
mmetsp:Transcript_19281/g.30133  ORF Transcript_19281/g.30133 Transcript_19281/m.30133 type:complete len:91 (+) Transcript_19281:1415-1687(+)